MNKSVYLNHINTWHRKRYTELMNYGSVVYSGSVHQGTFAIGSDETNDFCITESPSCPDFIGSFTVYDKYISFQINPPYGDPNQPLDNHGCMGMIVSITPHLSILVSPPMPDGEIILAVKDMKSWTVQTLQAALHDKKTKTFPLNPKDYIVSGKLKENIVTFTLLNKVFQMHVDRIFGNKFYLYFGDATNGYETYLHGRMVEGCISVDYSTQTLESNNESHIYLDFNTAYHRSCAFAAHFDCPSLSPQNIVSIRIEAGEMMPF